MNTTPILRRSPRGAFTLVELLVVIGIIGLLVAILVPSTMRARALAQRATCGNNVRDIVRGCMNYARDGAWNRPGGGGTYVPEALPNIHKPTENPWDWSDLKSGNPGCLWLLLTGRGPDYSGTPYVVKQSWVGFSTFMCPESGRLGKRAPAIQDGQFEKETISYGYLSQVPVVVPTHSENGVTIPAKTYAAVSIHDLSPSTVIVADSNPWLIPGNNAWALPSESNGNSLNHRSEGQNVGTMDGAVNWMTTSKLQDGKDDIYLPDALDIPNAPAGNPSPGSQAEGRRSLPSDNLILY